MTIDNFNTRILLKGKGIKYAVLVDSENNLKVIPYSLDYLTFLFGGITYLFRKEILKGIALLFIQILSIYILDIPIGIILNFVITFIASMFSGKSYTNKLIREGALPFDEYEENGYSHEYDESIAISRASEKRGSRMLEDYKSSIKRQNTIFYCLGSLTLISIILITGFEMKLKDSSAEKTLTTKPSEEKISENIKLEIPNEFVVLLTDKGSLESFALIKYDEKNCKLSGKYYNGQVLINRDNKSIPLNEVFKSEGILPQNMFKKYFGINKKLTQIKVDINKLEELLPKIKNSKMDEQYKGLLIKSTKLDDEKYEELIEGGSILNDLDGEINEDYLDDEIALGYKKMILDSKINLDIKKGNYYEIALNSIASDSVIESYNIKQDILYYFDYSDLDHNNLIKKLRGE